MKVLKKPKTNGNFIPFPQAERFFICTQEGFFSFRFCELPFYHPSIPANHKIAVVSTAFLLF